jgi:hypothetical protein
VQRVRVGERALELGGRDGVRLPWFGAAAVADQLLAFAVGPAGAVGDDVAELRGDEATDDLPHGIELLGAERRQAGPDVVPEPEVAGRRLGAPLAGEGASFAVLGCRGLQVGVAQARAGEVALLARRRLAVVGLAVLSGDVEHDQRIDRPDAAREVAAAIGCPRVAPVGGAVVQRRVDVDLSGRASTPSKRGRRVASSLVRRQPSRLGAGGREAGERCGGRARGARRR